MFDRFRSFLSGKLQGLLKLFPAPHREITVEESLSFETNIAVNRLWYRGDGWELAQAYRQIGETSCSFWGSVPTHGLEIRKIHTGLPQTMVNMLSGLIAADLQEVQFPSESQKLLWQQMETENNFCELIKYAITETLVTGDGAFKISLNAPVSPHPILEFYGADRVEIRRQSGRICEIIFRTPYTNGSKNYMLHEHYGRGYVKYALFDAYGNPRDLHAIPQTADLQPVRWDGDFMLAEYLSFYHSNRYEGRGQSIFDAKRDSFDALDEAWSQWVDALRSGRPKTYVPEMLVPRDENGTLQRSNPFDNRFIMTGNDTGESAQNKIVTVQPEIPHDSYLATYITALDLCLQGIVSPSTLGIDVKKLDNAEAQREKEKTTLYTRQDIVSALQRVLPKLITDVFYAYQTANGQPAEEVRAAVTFGEYANPSFESQVETVAKAKQGGIMSIEAGLDELYGSTKSDTWKAAEAERIRTEQGIVDMEEPAVSDEIPGDTA